MEITQVMILLLFLYKFLCMKTSKKCFVCGNPVPADSYELNLQVNMPECNSCKGTEQEKKIVEEMLDSLADGLVCGCI